MKLIGTPGSPYTRKVRIVLAEKRIDYDFVNDAPSAAATQVPKTRSIRAAGVEPNRFIESSE